MKESHAIQALSALAHEHRMAIFKTLMREGPSGLPAGAIGERLELGGSKVSFHVGLMERAGLLRSWRVNRHIYYAVEIDGMRELLGFLTEDCCGGHPDICGALFETAQVCGDD